MSEILSFLTTRSTIISIAVLGAAVSILGGYYLPRKTTVSEKTAKLVLQAGYVISWSSVAGFIVAGFMAN